MEEHNLQSIADSSLGEKSAIDIQLSQADSYAYRKGPDLPFMHLMSFYKIRMDCNRSVQPNNFTNTIMGKGQWTQCRQTHYVRM